MLSYDTKTLTEAALKDMSADRVSNIYNGLDCCLTYEIYEVLMEELASEAPNVQQTYADAIRKQGPFLTMEFNGLLVDSKQKTQVIADLTEQLSGLIRRFNKICMESFGIIVNAKSHVQVKDLFYDTLGYKPIKKRNSKGIFAPAADEETLLKLRMNFHAEVFVNYILAIREISKMISFLNTGLDEDEHFRTSINVAGTNTGRSASSKSGFGSGSNLQNVDRQLRSVFIPDPGYIYVNVDLEQADARNLGASAWNMFYDELPEEIVGAFLNACESGDLHTTVCRMTWDDLPWGDDPKLWKSVAKTPFGDGDSYRDKAKKLGHGTNYLGQPRTMAVHTKTPVKIIEDFQQRYFRAFPIIPKWHERRIAQIRDEGQVTTLFGRRRHFFDRGNDPSTHRAGIAYEPQSMTGHEMDMGICQLFESETFQKSKSKLLIQVHDSILFQVPYDGHKEIIPQALESLRFDFILKGNRKFYVPLEAKVGWNWGDVITDKSGNIVGNHSGLMVWKGEELRPRPKG